MGRGAKPPKRSDPVPLHLGIAELGVDRGRHVADGAVRPDGVVVLQAPRCSVIRLNMRLGTR